MARLKAFHAAMQALYLLMVGKHSYLMDTDEFIIDCTSKPDVAFPKAEAVHFYRLTANGPLDVTALVAWGGVWTSTPVIHPHLHIIRFLVRLLGLVCTN
jgi:hypothetical protein